MCYLLWDLFWCILSSPPSKQQVCYIYDVNDACEQMCVNVMDSSGLVGHQSHQLCPYSNCDSSDMKPIQNITMISTGLALRAVVTYVS